MTDSAGTRIRSLANRLRRRPLYLLFAAALAAIAVGGFWPRALPVETARVDRGPLTVSFTEEGRTRLQQRYQISARS